METINDRINLIVRNEKVTNVGLGEIVGISSVSVSNKLLGKRKWDIEEVAAISKHFGNYSAEWLLNGSCSMFASKSTTNAIATGDNNIQVSGNGSSAVVNNELINVLQHQLEVKDKQIEILMSKLG